MFVLTRFCITIIVTVLLSLFLKFTIYKYFCYLVIILIIDTIIALTFVKSCPELRRYTYFINKICIQLMRPIARLMNLEHLLLLSFCHWNNNYTKQIFKKNKSKRTIIVLPHCIQIINCNANVVTKLSECHRCQLCTIHNLVELEKVYNWNICIENRSHKIYKKVLEYKPNLIIAVSCLDRLHKGIINLPKIPSYVIPLQLKQGMCVNTTFDLNKLIDVMKLLAQ